MMQKKRLSCNDRRREKEGAHLEKLARLEVVCKAEQSFDINRACSFIPPFDESAVDILFEMFEKAAIDNTELSKRLEEKWPLLVQSSLGKLREH